MPAVDFDWRIFFEEELRNERAAYELRRNGGPGGAFDAPVEFHDEEPVEEHVRERTDDFAEHGSFWVAHGAYKVVHARSDGLEYCSAKQDAHVAGGYRKCLVACAKQFE